MNFGNNSNLFRFNCVALSIMLPAVFFTGCSDNITLPTTQELAAFNSAGPIQPELDLNLLVNSKRSAGLYRITIGDMVELQMPQILRIVTAEYNNSPLDSTGHFSRVFENGKITLPIIGELDAAGKTISQLEESVINAYYPKYCVDRPSVVAYVREYRTSKVSITGAVVAPGIYELQSDQMSLVSLIMAAGGIVEDGAAVIRIDKPDSSAPDGDASAREELLAKLDFDSDKALSVSDLKFSYRQDQYGNAGTMLVRRNDGIVYSRRINVTILSQRVRFTKDLVAAEPDVSAIDTLRHMSKLADAIVPGSGSQRIAFNDEALQEEFTELIGLDKDASTNSNADAPLVLPVKGLNIPFADVSLIEGTSVEITAIDPEVFTVVGLVGQSGVFPYPATAQYNLMQALAFAGGVDEIADPRFVRVYRQTADGQVVDASFELTGSSLVGAPNIAIKPGDVVSVEQTSRTRTNLLLAEVLQLRVGAGVNAGYNVMDITYRGKDLRSGD